MQNPFNHENYPSNDLKRNTFPCSFQTNLTMKYGYIYPAGIWRTVPGATYRIQPTLGLNFMPTTFPVQTRQKVYVHYFYGRDRNFWKDYKDFVNGQRPDLVKPYIDESVTKARTGKLLDYLGVPTTLVGSYGSYDEIEFDYSSFNEGGLGLPYLNSSVAHSIMAASSGQSELLPYPYIYENGNSSTIQNYDNFSFSNLFDFNQSMSLFEKSNSVYVATVDRVLEYVDVPLVKSISLDVPIDEWLSSPFYSDPDYSYSSALSRRADSFAVAALDSSGSLIEWSFYPTIVNQGVLRFAFTNSSLISKICVFVPNAIRWTDNGTVVGQFDFVTSDTQNLYPSSIRVKSLTDVVQGKVVDIDDSNSPYWRSGTTDSRERIKLNAYLPRMYETIYNLYYRNPQNNPYILNGVPEYNKFMPSKDGGVDSNLYELRRRNWEDDFLTTAVQSPQQGIAPLVGLTDRGATLTLTNDDGSVTRYNVSVADNGSLTGIEATDTTAEPVLTKALIDAVSYGISIEDIRNVNAMQKWLELNLRKGYQYKDIIQARWGISISYNELDLPEFIGGFSRDVQLQAVTQTANVNDDVTGQLGWQGGRLFASGEGREITHYCDEEGYIMCLVTTVPVPNYSQLLPKHWFERDLLDSYQPEFNHIGFQPITYKEVCPVQAFQESTENVNVLEQTFGYQRPWYQYFNYTDEVHGQFRTTFKDFLINRVFDVKPELSESFLLVDPEQVNDVFNVTDPDDDKILGAIYHNCVAKLPISLYAQARLE